MSMFHDFLLNVGFPNRPSMNRRGLPRRLNAFCPTPPSSPFGSLPFERANCCPTVTTVDRPPVYQQQREARALFAELTLATSPAVSHEHSARILRRSLDRIHSTSSAASEKGLPPSLQAAT